MTPGFCREYSAEKTGKAKCEVKKRKRVSALQDSSPKEAIWTARYDLYKDELANDVCWARKVYDMVSFAATRIDVGIFLADAVAENSDPAAYKGLVHVHLDPFLKRLKFSKPAFFLLKGNGVSLFRRRGRGAR